MTTSNASAMLFDSNVWLALTFSAHPHHAQAKELFAETNHENPASFCRATQQSFLRLATTPAILRAYGAEGFTNQDAAKLITTLTALPAVSTLEEPPGLEPRWLQLAKLPSASPKVWMDAYLAAFAIRHGTAFVTLDHDFQNFEKAGLKLRLLTP
jgi:toxin-antitoxin system PIN domain toxin